MKDYQFVLCLIPDGSPMNLGKVVHSGAASTTTACHLVLFTQRLLHDLVPYFAEDFAGTLKQMLYFC